MLRLILIGIVPLFCFVSNTYSGNATSPLTEDAEFLQKTGQFASRMMWMTHRRKLVLPRGTILNVTPKITFPVFRHKPFDGGLNSDISASWIFYIYFDKLGMTSDEHPWPFDMPPFYPFGNHMRPLRTQGDIDKDKDTKEKVKNKNREEKPFPYIKHVSSSENSQEKTKSFQQAQSAPHPYFFPSPFAFQNSNSAHHRKPRSVMSLPPPENIHGGERAIIMPSVESFMSSLGFEGRACLLRAVCEVHEFPLRSSGYGLIGEMITLFFSISESVYAETHMPEYLRAEMDGKNGDCSFYYKNCTKSIFKWEPKNTEETIILKDNEL